MPLKVDCCSVILSMEDGAPSVEVKIHTKLEKEQLLAMMFAAAQAMMQTAVAAAMQAGKSPDEIKTYLEPVKAAASEGMAKALNVDGDFPAGVMPVPPSPGTHDDFYRTPPARGSIPGPEEFPGNDFPTPDHSHFFDSPGAP